jgi:Ca2+-binding EF-hand superfamily protein
MQMFSSIDSNGDGALNFEEFSAMPRPENRPQGADADDAVEQRFTRADTDGNGLLSPDELEQGQRRGNGGGMLPQGQDDMRQRMENMTPEQREQMRESMQQMTPEQRQQMMQRRQGFNSAPTAPAVPAPPAAPAAPAAPTSD